MSRSNKMKIYMVFIMVLLIGAFSGCKESSSAPHGATGAGVGLEQRVDLLELLKQKYPDQYKDIAIHGTNPDRTLLLFMVKRGGTYLLRRNTGEIETIHHAKLIDSGMITKISYENRKFKLWAGDRL